MVQHQDGGCGSIRHDDRQYCRVCWQPAMDIIQSRSEWLSLTGCGKRISDVNEVTLSGPVLDTTINAFGGLHNITPYGVI